LIVQRFARAAHVAALALCCFDALACYTLAAVEHPCPKCSEAVVDGTPFCRHCRAPQIRVAIEPSPELAGRAEMHQDRTDSSSSAPVFIPELPRALGQKVDWTHGLPCAAMGGIASLFLSLIPFALFGPAFLLGGALAAFLYKGRTKSNPTRGMGARLGAASGGFGFLFSAVITVATVVYASDKVREAMIAKLNAGHYDPDDVRRVTDMVNTPEGLATLVVFTLVAFAVVFVIGGSIGGAWYSAWMQKRNRE
jgi:hypothetical protein